MAVVDPEWARDGKIYDSGSVISGLSSLDDDTDEFGRIVVQHVRDEQRLNQALNGQRQPFSKARPRQRIAATLEHANGSLESDRRSLSSGASDPGVVEHTYTNGSDPPLNVPREWGRKARKDIGWLKRLGDTDLGPERPASADDAFAQTGRHGANRIAGTDWAVGGNQPVQSVEQDTPLSAKSRRQISSPARAGRENKSIDRIRQWEAEQDFTAGSILESTPALASRSIAFDSSRKDVLIRMESRAIATDRLSRISEQSSPEAIREELEARLSRISSRPLSGRRRPSPDDKRWGGSRALVGNKENVPLNGSLHDMKAYAPTEDGRPISHTDVANGSSRPTSSRADSLQMLKRLARVTSQSPNPSPNGDDQHLSNPKQTAAPNTSRGTRQSSAQAPEVIPPPESDPRPRSTSRLSASLLSKTPKIIGGWIDTPFAKRHDSAQPSPPKISAAADDAVSPAPKDPLAELPQHNHRDAPKSALSALLHPADSDPPPDLKLGDDTLRSLQSLLSPSGPTTAENTADLSATLQLDAVKAELDALHRSGRPLSQADEERRDELLAIEGMNERLRTARRGVREVGRGLRDVEKKVEGASFGSRRAESVECQVCEGGVWKMAGREVVGVFISDEVQLGKEGRWLARLTWAGAAVALGLAWWMLESAACARYCQPVYAERMVGFGVDPDAPKYPFVIPTLMFRPLRWLWRPLFGAIFWAMSNLWSAFVAYISIPFEDEPGTASTAKLKPRAPILQSKRSGHWDEPDPIYEVRENTKMRSWDIPNDKIDRDDHQLAYGTFDDDRVIEDTVDKQGSTFKFAKLWSWKGSPAESTAESSPSASEDVQESAEFGRMHSEDTHFGSSVWETGDGMDSDEIL